MEEKIYKNFYDFRQSCIDESDKYKNYFDDEMVEIPPGEQVFAPDTMRKDWVIVYQNLMCFKLINDILASDPNFREGRRKLLDVGSNFSTVSFLSVYFDVAYLECRNDLPPDSYWKLPGIPLTLLNGEAQNIPTDDGSVDMITCLHALEHFGLGRYGDTIDYYGDQKALNEYERIMSDDGYLLLSVPFSPNDSPRIQFHDQRIYHYSTIDQMLDAAGFEVKEHMFVYPIGGLRDEDGNLTIPLLHDKSVVDTTTFKREHNAVYITLSQKKKKQ